MPTQVTTPTRDNASGDDWSWDTRTVRALQVVPVTDEIRALDPVVLGTARYAAVYTVDGRPTEVLTPPVYDVAGWHALRIHAQEAAKHHRTPYVEAGVWCSYCERFCPPDVVADHQRWARGSETAVRAA